jgi:hypothetical protein
MDELVEKYRETKNPALKLQILTLSPYTIERTIHKFNSTKYMVNKARKLKNHYGILPEIPFMSKGKIVTKETKDIVKNFYENDEYSRQCPGVKDYKSCKNDDGIREKKQKRLLLSNLKELYHDFREKHPDYNDYIGFSSFASLRPQWCMLSGSNGTHSVCVCTYHQNPKLQVAALGIKDLNYKDLMKQSVCDFENESCMMHVCTDCPRAQGVKDEIDRKLSEQDSIVPDEVRYKQWVTTDRCTIIEKIENINDYTDSLSSNISKLTRHHYISKAQSNYFQNLKENLADGEGCLIGDFAENYSFVVQDAAQGFHWENSQCTVHPFVFYWRDNGELHHQSYCFISDCLKHNTITVYSFQTKLIPMIHSKHPNLTKIHYFTDGCGGQYKNKSNFLNLCYHQEDFGIKAEWNFFATSHGKNACDGIGGVVKRSTAKASLQRHITNQILTPKDMYNYCKNDLKSKIEFIYIEQKYVEEIEARLFCRFNLPIKPITGTLKLHRFVPLTKETLRVHLISQGTAEVRNIIRTKEKCIISENLDDIKIGSFIACRYDDKLWFGLVEEFDMQHDDYIIKFLHPQGINPSFTFPSTNDICPIDKDDIFGSLESALFGGTRIRYKFSDKDMSKFQKMVYSADS